MLKRIISLILILLMLIPSIVACRKDSISESSDTAGSGDDTVETDESEVDKYDVKDSVGTRDYGGREITVGYVAAGNMMPDIELDNLTGDLIQDSVYKRNRTVESRLNIKLLKHEGETTGALTSTLRLNVSSGECPFDLMLNPLYDTCGVIKEGVYRDLSKCEDIDLSQDYWSYYANSALNIGGIQYVATGPISYTYYSKTFCTVVNEKILKDVKDGEVPDLISVVKTGGWTMEYQRQLANKYYDDQGVTGEKDDQDIAGFYGAGYGSHLDCYLVSLNVVITEKDRDGYLKVNFDVGRAATAVDIIGSLHRTEGAVCTTDSDPIPLMASTFGSGRALMTTLNFHEIVTKLGDMSDPYMLIPMPKLDDTQSQYYTALHDSTAGISMPITVAEDDVQMMGAVIEVMASESYRQMSPAYYETALKMRYVSSPDNWEIMDIMMASAVLDPSTPFARQLIIGDYSPIGWWRRICRRMVNNNTNVTSSTFNDQYLVNLETLVSGEDGLNDYYKKVNGN